MISISVAILAETIGSAGASPPAVSVAHVASPPRIRIHARFLFKSLKPSMTRSRIDSSDVRTHFRGS